MDLHRQPDGQIQFLIASLFGSFLSLLDFTLKNRSVHMVFISPTVINVLGFKINTLDNGAVANMGSLQLIDQFVSYKRNQGIWGTKWRPIPYQYSNRCCI